ncbi:MAG: GGDEF domain-containing protein [Treponema sp.]|nr:GGDEF domain-containing protein [Treponema sp.]
MKNIAVLVYELTIEYNCTVLDGIVDFFEKKEDVNLIISPVNIPLSNSSEFDYQYWTSVKVLNSESIDAFIVITNSFLSNISIDTLSEKLKKLCSKPIVSISVPLNIPGSKYIHVSCGKTYEQIIEHIVKVHKCTRIGFFTAAMTYSKDAEERFTAYKKALKKNHLDFNPEFVIDGDFTPGIAEEKFLERFKSKDDIPFQALLCANDYTAAGVQNALDKIGVKCPDDLLLFGFDDSEIALVCYPALSTINQSVDKSGKEAARMVYDILKGKQVGEYYTIQTTPVYRQSCGCVNPSLHNTTGIDQSGNMILDGKRIKFRFENFSAVSYTFTTIYGLLNQMDTSSNLSVYLEGLKYKYGLDNVSELSIVMYKEPVLVGREDSFEVPDEAKLIFYSNKGIKVHKNYFDKEDYIFNPKKEVVPEEFFNRDCGRYILVPLYNRKWNYGYIVFMFYSHNYSLMSIYGKILSNSLLQAYSNFMNSRERDDLLEENKNLNISAKIDELSKLLNRRGFFEYGQKTINLSLSMDKEGCVFFCDLDGLKKINDNFGHDMGDSAIQLVAQVLKKVFRESDIVARLSGDEFGIIAPSFRLNNLENLRKKIAEENEKISRENNLPFILSLSMGCAEYGHDRSNLSEILSKADEKLYEEKRLKHQKK